jgi:hypothetical protein
MFFESLRSSGVDWTPYASQLNWGLQRSRRFWYTEESDLLDTIVGVDNPAMLAAWATVLGSSYGGTNDNFVLAQLEERMHALLRGEIRCRNDGELHYAVQELAIAYNNVLSNNRKGEWFVPFIKGAYAIAGARSVDAIDELLVHQIRTTVGKPLVGATNPVHASPVDQIIRMFTDAMPRLLPKAENDKSKRSECIRAWATLQTVPAFERLSKLSVNAKSDFERELYLDAIVEWEKVAQQRASGK